MAEQTTHKNGAEQLFDIQRLYLKDLSFESPSVPKLFQEEWKPEVKLEIQTTTNPLEENVHEVTLTATVTTTQGKSTAFLVEIKYAGVFMINGFPEEQMQHMLGSFCPNLLFPYAREVVTDVVVRGGFPPLYLAPINFDALYAESVAQQEKGVQATPEDALHPTSQ